MSRSALFQKRPHKLDLPGGAIYVRAFTVGELMHVEELREGGRSDAALEYTIRRCVTDEKGEQLLGDDDSIDDMPFDTVWEIADIVNRLTTGKPMRSLEKNSDETGSSDS